MEQIIPVIDTALLQQKANEAAMKGAIQVVENFYTGYDSPWKKAIEADLNGKSIDGYKMELPDILAVLNESISKEFDVIANTAIAKTFVPLASRFLTRREKEINLSDLLKEFIETSDEVDVSREDFDLSIVYNDRHQWYNIEISDSIRHYKGTLHSHHEDRGKPVQERRYYFISLPDCGSKSMKTMKISYGDGCTLELPFVKDVLCDNFLSYVAGLIIADSMITLDTNCFQDHHFPDDGCHCH